MPPTYQTFFILSIPKIYSHAVTKAVLTLFILWMLSKYILFLTVTKAGGACTFSPVPANFRAKGNLRVEQTRFIRPQTFRGVRGKVREAFDSPLSLPCTPRQVCRALKESQKISSHHYKGGASANLRTKATLQRRQRRDFSSIHSVCCFHSLCPSLTHITIISNHCWISVPSSPVILSSPWRLECGYVLWRNWKAWRRGGGETGPL